jgi:hypothetical protein
MASNGRRIAVWISLASYLFAVTAANSLHDHGLRDEGDHGSACRHALSTHSDHGMDLRAMGPCDGRCAAVARSSGPLAACSDGCPVCNFLLLKLLPMRPVESVHAEALRETAVAAQPLAAVRAPLLLQRSRAPPPIA